jgi:hypothetical protein
MDGEVLKNKGLKKREGPKNKECLEMRFEAVIKREGHEVFKAGGEGEMGEIIAELDNAVKKEISSKK